MKNDHKGKDKDGEETLENKGGKIEVKDPGQDIDAAQKAYTHQHKARCGVLEPDKGHIDQWRNDNNIKDVLDTEAFEKGKDGIAHETFNIPFLLNTWARYTIAEKNCFPCCHIENVYTLQVGLQLKAIYL